MKKSNDSNYQADAGEKLALMMETGGLGDFDLSLQKLNEKAAQRFRERFLVKNPIE